MNRRYTPDFVIKQDGKVIYIEHFGITEDKEIVFIVMQI